MRIYLQRSYDNLIQYLYLLLVTGYKDQVSCQNSNNKHFQNII